jgi:2-haloacid dehalogenase
VTRWATFDCYGTLIDWNGGIRRELARIWPHADPDLLLRRYHELEPQIQREDPSRTYREVMRRALDALGEVPTGEEDALGTSLARWEPFSEVPAALADLRRRGWKLAILSNTDREFIEASKARLSVPFDETIVASEIGSYKPAHRHWQEFFARTKVDRVRHVHVAASIFHDVEPATELSLTSVWINRLGERSNARPTRELPDLERLPETLDELVAA